MKHTRGLFIPYIWLRRHDIWLLDSMSGPVFWFCLFVCWLGCFIWMGKKEQIRKNNYNFGCIFKIFERMNEKFRKNPNVYSLDRFSLFRNRQTQKHTGGYSWTNREFVFFIFHLLDTPNRISWWWWNVNHIAAYYQIDR